MSYDTKATGSFQNYTENKLNLDGSCSNKLKNVIKQTKTTNKP